MYAYERTEKRQNVNQISQNCNVIQKENNEYLFEKKSFINTDISWKCDLYTNYTNRVFEN